MDSLRSGALGVSVGMMRPMKLPERRASWHTGRRPLSVQSGAARMAQLWEPPENTRSAVKDAPAEYRAVIMKAPEGYAQSVWDAVRNSTGNRLPSPYTLGNRIESLQRQASRSAAEERTLKAMQEMKARLEKLRLDFE
jgi:hypothetical protein